LSAPRQAIQRDGGYSGLWVPAGAFRRISNRLEQGVDEDVRSGADAERPVAAEPAPGVIVGGCGTHQPGEHRSAFRERANGEVVHGLGVARLIEADKAIGADLRVLDHRPPELADQTEGDLLARSFAEQDPATLLGLHLGELTDAQRFGRMRRTFAVQQLTDDLGKHAKRAGERDAFTDLEQVGVHQRFPDDLRLGVDDGRDLVRHVVDGEEVVSEHCREGSAARAA
jgi:hypothetical protein